MLFGNEISIIGKNNSLLGQTELLILSLMMNQIQVIEEDAFRDLGNVQTLALQGHSKKKSLVEHFIN